MKADERIAAQLSDALNAYGRIEGDLAADSVSDASLIEVHTLLTAAIDAVAPRGSAYRRRADDALAEGRPHWQVHHLAGVVRALQSACRGGYLQTVTQLAQADVFHDFLEMGEHLLETGYKDPAAILAGGVLEEHLRQLCGRNGITISIEDRAKNASRLNEDLATAEVYSRLDAKSVTAWLDLRNLAAHGKYAQYSAEQVKLMIHGVRHFAARTISAG